MKTGTKKTLYLLGAGLLLGLLAIRIMVIWHQKSRPVNYAQMLYIPCHDPGGAWLQIGLTSRKAVMLVLVDPDCDACRHEIAEITGHVNEMPDVDIYLATFDHDGDGLTGSRIQPEDPRLHTVRFDRSEIAGITTGWYMPTVLLFDAKKKFLKIYRGEVSAAALIRDFQAGANLHSRSSE